MQRLGSYSHRKKQKIPWRVPLKGALFAILAAVALILLLTLFVYLGWLGEGAIPIGNTVIKVLAAALAGAAVSLAGLLSFVGLLVPHAVRRLSGGGRHLFPLCILYGGGFVSLSDTLARTLFAPHELPVGIIMAFLGAPLFLVILIKRKGGHSHA